MNNSTLFVTSMNQALFNLTGKQFLHSFDKHIGGDLVITVDDDGKYLEERKVLYLKDSTILSEWREKFKSRIPINWGGSSKMKSFFEHRKHKLPNANFFTINSVKQIVSLVAAAASPDYQYVIWLDCDTVFNKPVDFEKLFAGYPIIYNLGQNRHQRNIGADTCVLGFDVYNPISTDVVAEIRERYKDGRFLKNKRWDLSFLLMKIIEEKGWPGRDLAAYCRSTKVVEDFDNPLCEVITHKKGLHFKKRFIKQGA